MLKKCRDCGTILGKDKKSGHFWCTSCKEVKEEFDLKYKICIFGKNTGKEVGTNNFIKRVGQALVKEGHEVIGVKFGDIYSHTETWDMTDYFIEKKKIPLTFIDRIYSPDFIYVEQTYNRFDVSDIKCPVIYQHREYTHFPDIENPDMLLESYPNRLKTFEFYHPNQYNKIPYCDSLFVAVEPDVFNPNREKIIKGITMIGWATNPYNFANANGIWATIVIEDQVSFYQDCVKKGYVTYIKGEKFTRYKDLLEQCEAVLIDGGHVNAFSRRLFEAIASKTLCIVRVHNVKNREIFKEIGLTSDMCYFIYNPEDIEELSIQIENIKDRESKVEKAYEWMMENHTYKNRGLELIEKFEEFKNGMKKKEKYMGYANHSDVKIKEGELVYRELI